MEGSMAAFDSLRQQLGREDAMALLLHLQVSAHTFHTYIEKQRMKRANAGKQRDMSKTQASHPLPAVLV
jgi:hypothetical protein